MNPIRSALAALVATVLVCACDQRSAGGSDDIDTSLDRLVVDQSGHPVASATAVLVASGDSTGRPRALSGTDREGRLPTFVVPDGYYGLLLRDPGDSLGRFVDSIPVRSGRLPSGTDTLLTLGTIRGTVRLQPGHSPATVAVSLLGTDIRANTAADGGFVVRLVPGGLYTLVAATSLDGYEPSYLRLRLRAGESLVLSDTLVLPFTGLPAPTGLSASEDSLTGNVSLRWDSVSHPDLYGYDVEVLEAGEVVGRAFTAQPRFVDSLERAWKADPLFGPWPVRQRLYRVSSRAAGGTGSPSKATTSWSATPPSWTGRVRGPSLARIRSASGRPVLSWCAVGNPSIETYRIERFADGVLDCRRDTPDTVWADTSCPDGSWRIVDSIHTPRDGRQAYLRRQAKVDRTWRLSALRKRDAVVLDSLVLDDSTARDFVGDEVGAWDPSDLLGSSGNWLVRSPRHNLETTDSIREISRDGVAWERVDRRGLAVGNGDSLRIVRLSTDSHTVVWATRTGEGLWKTDSVRMPFLVNGLQWGALDGSSLVLQLEWAQNPSWSSRDYRIVRISDGAATVVDSILDGIFQGSFSVVRSERGWIYAAAYGDPRTVLTRVPDLNSAPWRNRTELVLGVGWCVPLGPWSEGDEFLFHSGWGDLYRFDSTGNGVVVEMPSGTEQFAVTGSNLWAAVGKTLWKGSLR